jgi:hypothetical protein
MIGMWTDLKQILLDATGLGPNALHVVLALLIFAVAFTILRRPALAFLTVVAFQFLNEGLDAYFDIASGQGFKLTEAITDTVLTLAAAGAAWVLTWLAVKLLELLRRP